MSEFLFTRGMLDKVVLENGRRATPGTAVVVMAEEYNELVALREQREALRDDGQVEIIAKRLCFDFANALDTTEVWVRVRRDPEHFLRVVREHIEQAMARGRQVEREGVPVGEVDANTYADPADYLSDHRPELSDAEDLGFTAAINLLDQWNRP